MDGILNKRHIIRQIDLFTLKLFITIVEERQVGRAAIRENIAASAVTKRIQVLEEILGIQLFERSSRGVIPTPAGLALARHVKTIFGTLEEIRRDIGEFSDGVRGSIRVASTGGIISHFLANEIAEFANNFPQIDIDLREYSNTDAVRALSSGEVDVTIFVDSPEVRNEPVDTVDYRTHQLVAIMSLDHPLARRRTVRFADLLKHNLIAIAPSTTIMAHLRQAAEQEGVELKPKYSVNSIYAATSLVRVNQGITVQPEGMILAHDLARVCEVPLKEPWAVRHLRIGTQNGRIPSAATDSFLKQLKSQAE